MGNNGQRLRFTRAKDVKTTPADISSCHRGEVVKWQSPWQPCLTAAVRRGYAAARRCDGYGSHAYCDPRSRTAPALEALYNRAVRYRAGVGGVEFLTGGAPTADIIEYPDGTMAFNPTVV